MIKFYQDINWKIIIQIGAVLIIIVIFIMWNNYRLQKLVKERTAELEELSGSLELKVKEKTKELEYQKNHFKKFFENKGVGILIVDKNRNIKEVNEKFVEMWGYSEEEIIGKPAEILHISKETYLKFGEIAFGKILKNKPIEIEYKMKRKNGEIFWAKFSGELLEDEGSVLWIISDITELQKVKEKIEKIHKHTKESIEFASLIQNALVPQEDEINIFKDKFILWEPKDIVGGDIYLFETLRHEDECLLMCIDCTGHGVPGAFVTMIVKAVEREIVSKIKDDENMDVSPAWILTYFNKTIKKLLKQENIDSISNAGFDGGVIYYNKRTQILKFAGAETPLFYVDDKLNMIKGDRYSVGYKKSDANYEFKDHIIEVEEDMKFYISTDGFLDQNGGERGFPFGKKRFKKLIEESYTLPMQQQKQKFIDTIIQYQQNEERNDDITVIGFEIDKKSNNQDIFKYKGVITQNVIATAMDNIEAKLNMKLIPKIATITIEYCQNMINYSKNKIEGDKQIIPEGFIHIKYIDKGYYQIIAKNIISKEDKEKIESRLIEICSMDKTQIKKRYRELRRSGENAHQKGGGIGLYEIAKMSDEINYKFISINKDKFYFIMYSIIRPKEIS
jgi:PAS domain S-box-containing protein